MASDTTSSTRSWPLFLLLGVVLIIAGVLVMVFPGLTLFALGIFAGVGLLAAGLVELAVALTGAPESRALSAIGGVLAVLAGMVCLRRPSESVLVLVIVLGLYLVGSGFIHFLRAFSDVGNRAFGVGTALLDVVLGVLILAWPGVSLATLALLFAISLLAQGVFAIVFALRLRREPRHGVAGTRPDKTGAT